MSKYKKNKTYWLAGGHQVRRPIPFPNPDRAPTSSQIKKLSVKNLFKLQFK